MTEREWLDCSDLAELIRHVRPSADDRRLRFFAIANLRRQKIQFTRQCFHTLLDTLAQIDQPIESPEACELFREVFGNPIRPASFDRSWLLWRGGAIPAIAQGIHLDRGFDRLPYLADALEDAGCGDPAILEHCREPRIHVRGCWVIEALRHFPARVV